MGKNQTSFTKFNKVAEKWTDFIIPILNKIYNSNNIKKDCEKNNLSYKTFFYLCKKYNIKKTESKDKNKYDLSGCKSRSEKQLARLNQNIQLRIKNATASNIRERLRIKGFKKSLRTEKIIGCDWDFFLKHLQHNFKKGMSFDNYGEWHIDHVIPDSWFNYKSDKDSDFKKSWHYTNLKPMWREENISKKNKYSDDIQLKMHL